MSAGRGVSMALVGSIALRMRKLDQPVSAGA